MRLLSRTLSLCLSVAAASAMACRARAADHLEVSATREGDAVSIEASVLVHASLAVVWHTLTDYDHLAAFIPGLKSSHVLTRHGSAVVVAQTGRASFLFLSFPVDTVIEADEHFPTGIGARSLSGNIRLLSGGYRLELRDGTPGIVLRWTGLIEPQFWTPMFITVQMIRGGIADQLRAMADEIERREAVPPPAIPGTG